MKGADGEAIEEACAAFVQKRFKRSSESSSVAATLSGEEDEDNNVLRSELWLNPKEVQKVYIEIETILKDSYANSGRVEFMVTDDKKATKLILEAKIALQYDHGKGFWQTCSELVIASGMSVNKDVKFLKGVYLDFFHWQFILFDVAAKLVTYSMVRTFAEMDGKLLTPAIQIVQ